MNDASVAPPTTTDPVPGCPLCESPGGHTVWSDGEWRVIRVDDDAFPAFYRLVANAHVREQSDLSPAARHRCIDLLCTIERTLIEHVRPTKVNLATLGNAVPHLHWHVIGRFKWDSRFPEPIWAAPVRLVEPAAGKRLCMALLDLDDRVRAALVVVA